MSYRTQLTILIKQHAGNITDEELTKLYFTDRDGGIHQFNSYEDKRIGSIINDLVSCSWRKAEEFAKSFIEKSGEPRGPKEEIRTFTKSAIKESDLLSESTDKVNPTDEPDKTNGD